MGHKHVELCHSNYDDSVRYIHRVYIHMHCVCLHHSGYICNIPFAAPTEYGWRREDGQLHVIWEDAKNVEKSRASIDFCLSGCKCKTGPSCTCCFCKNTKQSAKETCRHETDLVVEDLLEEHNDEIYVDDSDDDLDHFKSEEMDKDEELRALMEFVFGDSSDEETL